MGQVIKIRPEAVAEYKRLHAAVWPEVREALSAANLCNYSIYLREPENLLFSYWEYGGEDFAADMRAMFDMQKVREWRNLCGPMHEPLVTRGEGEWWAAMEEIFHLD
jgi:L-rhamnose mutarotase